MSELTNKAAVFTNKTAVFTNKTAVLIFKPKNTPEIISLFGPKSYRKRDRNRKDIPIPLALPSVRARGMKIDGNVCIEKWAPSKVWS